MHSMSKTGLILVALSSSSAKLLQSQQVIRTIAKTMSAVSTDKKLFTPGPLGVSLTTKKAMLKDLGSRDSEFISTVQEIRQTLVELAGASPSEYTCVPVQGSGTMAIEAVIRTAVPKYGKVLILENGAYGKRQAKICETLGIKYHMESFQENEKVSPERVRFVLRQSSPIHMVSVVHCETSSGVFNDIDEIGQVVKEVSPTTTYFVDAMSSFGAVPLNVKEDNIDYLVSSANKCIEGVPGFAYAICRTVHLLKCKGNSRSLVLDLVDQYEGLESSGQFRFTPPTHTMLAFRQALRELAEEGGVAGRSKRYQTNRAVLRKGMTEMGFTEFLDPSHEGYIITSYNFPEDKNFNFKEFYERLSEKGQVIYPGKVLNSDCFRIGNIGHLYPEDMEYLLKCIKEVCKDMSMNGFKM